MASFSTPRHMDDIEKSAGQYGWGNLSFTDLITKFDISRFPDFQNAAEPYLAYIIMSRPDINLGNGNLDTLKRHPMTASYANDVYGYKLLQSLSNLSVSQMFLPIITTRAMSYSTGDVQLKTIDKGNTFYGHVIKYGKHSEDHKVGGTITLDFRNDRYQSMMKAIYLWMCYIYIVSKTGAVVPTEAYENTGILDYAASLYYLVTRRDGRELVYWEKLTGVFPVSAPFSIYSFSDDLIVQDRVSFEFAYGVKSDPNDPEVLMDLNYLSGISSSSFHQIAQSTRYHSTVDGHKNDPFVQKFGKSIVYPDNKQLPFAKGNVFATCPFIHMVKSIASGGNTIKYYLDWLDL